MQFWWIWFAVGAFFIVAEIFTAGFFLICFGLGSAVAGILAVLNLAPIWQWGAFIVVSGILIGFSRRFADKISKKPQPGIGSDRLIDKKAIVIEPIHNLKNTGEVRIDKELWRADSSDDNIIFNKDDIVKVIKVEGVHVIVEKFEE